MIPIVAMLVDTSIAYEGSSAENFVHEWGVVVFDETHDPLICGSPWNDAEMYNDMDMCAEAPVVWIHGEPFYGTFTVKVGTGETFTTIYPDPDVLENETAEWNLSSVSGNTGFEETERMVEKVEQPGMYNGPFAWATEYWRAVPSLSLYNQNTGITENFLYYECTVNSGFADNFLEWNPDRLPVFTGDEIVEGLFFTPYGVTPVEIREDEFIPFDFSMGGELDPQLIPETFCRWAGSRFKTSEITALWETWKPAFTEEGSFWLVFPIPEEYNSEISTIHLETSDDREVEYERLFLGAVKLEQR